MSRSRAIHQHCKACIYDPYSNGTWRQQTEACSSTQCALWPYRAISRPRQRAEGTAQDSLTLSTEKLLLDDGSRVLASPARGS